MSFPCRPLALTLLLVLGGCEAELVTEPDAGPAPSGTIEADALCATIVGLVCETDARCCTTSPADCEEVQADECESALQPLIDDPRLGYDPSGAYAFVEGLRARAAECWAEPLDYDGLATVFAGTGEEGADCTPRNLELESLRVSSLSCAGELACRIYLRADGSHEGECAARAADDDGCSHPLDCGAGQFCSLPDAWRPGAWGTCRPLRTDGWACESDLECGSRHCAEQAGERACGAPVDADRCLESRHATLVEAAAPLAWLRFDEASGSAMDSAGTHEGTLSATVVRDPSGAIVTEGPDPVVPAPTDAGAPAMPDGGVPDAGVEAPTSDGGAVRFASDDAFVQLAPLTELASASELSLEVWFRPDGVEATGPLLEWGDGVAFGPHLWCFDRGDKIFANLVDEAGEAHSVMSAEGAVTAGRWHHAVLTHDGEVGVLYLDGRRIGETTAEGPLRLDGALWIGHRPGSEVPAVSFRGAIDEVAVYDRALDPVEVRRHREAGVDGALRTRFALFRWLEP